MNHKLETAGHIMLKKVPTAMLGMHIGDVENMLLKNIKKLESINYVYIVDNEKKLKGVLSIKEIFRQPKTRLVDHIMNKEIVAVHERVDQEKVVYKALKNKIKALPVIDKNGVFLGAVLSDKILEVAYQEVHEDILKRSGIHKAEAKFDNVLKIPLWKALAHRLPWLLFGLLGGLLAAEVIGQFEETLEESIILASFIPLTVYLADAARVQMEAFIFRDLIINPKLNFTRYILRQLAILILVGFVIGISVFGTIYVLQHDAKLALILGIALFITISSSFITGLLIPQLFRKLNIDPANASGPVGTIVQDLLSVTIYFIVASQLLAINW